MESEAVTTATDKTAEQWELLHFNGVNGADGQYGLPPVTGDELSDFIQDEAETGESLQVLEGHADVLNSAQFSPDGSQVVTASDDMTARIWYTVEGLLSQAKRWIQREPPIFSSEEHQRFGIE